MNSRFPSSSGLRLRSGRTLLLSLLAILWFAVLLGCASGHGASPAAFTASASRIGSLRITPSTSYAAVGQYLDRLQGAHPQTRILSGECRISSEKYGVKVVLSAFSRTGSSSLPRACQLRLIEMTNAAWHTTNGLHPGDTVVKLHRLFPRAVSVGKNSGGEHWARPTNAIEWWLAPSSQTAEHPNLAAYVHDGHVIALVINMVGH